MKIFELDQQMGMTPPTAPGQVPQGTSAVGPAAGTPGATQAADPADPQAMAKSEAERKKQVQVQRKQVQDQIRAIDAQKAQLQKQLQSIK